LEEAAHKQEQIEELYHEEREKNEDLIKHLNQSHDPEQKRTQSARPKSASKYGRKTDSQNVSHHDLPGDLQEIEDHLKVEEVQEDLRPPVSFTDIAGLGTELRMRLQRIGIGQGDLGSMVVGSKMCLRDFKLTLSNKLKLPEAQAL
jgi:hypothetical protein